jgi:hypothetical protein
MAFASIVIALVALIVAGYALREARIANALPGALAFLGQYRDLAADRRLIVSELAPELGMSDIPAEIRDQVDRVSHYLDQLGFLVDHQLVKAEVVAGFMGDSIIRLWKILSPYVEAERQRRGEDDYQRYFENLAETMREIEPAKARARLKRFDG